MKRVVSRDLKASLIATINVTWFTDIVKFSG